MKSEPKFDIALSFAGENRAYVDIVAHLLKEKGIKVFYDLFEAADLWGKDLYVHLSEVYQKQARFTVMFISKAYGEKLWTNHERMAAQARAFQESQEYILPVRFDDTDIPGVLPTVGYVSLSDRSPEQLVSLITRKLVSAGGSVPTELVRKDYGVATASSAADPTHFSVSVVNDEDAPVGECMIVLQADNGTTVESKTDANGQCSIAVKTRRQFKLLAAHPIFPAMIINKVDPSETMQITLPRTDNVGSTIIHSTGHIPGLKGRLNPIFDTSDRTYLYADNIAINGGQSQPATFVINEPIELEDADGNVVFATVKHIAARVSLIQYSRR